MKPIQFLTNRNGVYYFRRLVPISLRSILNRREIVLTLKTSDFKDACMAALEMSKELDGLFNRLKQGVELITPRIEPYLSHSPHRYSLDLPRKFSSATS